MSGQQKVRVAKLWIPDPWELHVYPAPADAAAQSGWQFVKEDKRPGPTLRVGDKQQRVVHTVRVYRGRIAGMPLLEASADTRLNRSQVEKFLASLEPAGQ